MSSACGSEGDPREYPRRPIVGVAGVVLHANHVLLVRRGREPLLGLWCVPGGVLHLGETVRAGIVREVLEETGIEAHPVEHLLTLDRIVTDAGGRVRYHYILIDWLCTPEGACDPAQPLFAGDDAREAGWFPFAELATLEDLDVTTLDVIRLALDRDRRL